MDILDTPIDLKFKNGNNFPPNFVIIAYVILAGGLLMTITGNFIVGIIALVLALFAITNRHIVHIDPEQNCVHDYSLYFGFIKLGKKYPLDKYKYITTMPLIESQQVYASTSNSTTLSNTYTTLTLFGERFKGKRILTKFDSKNEAKDVAVKLADRLGLVFFDYDPKLVRQVLLGQISIEDAVKR
jgi:hypothetical protein